VVGARGLSRAAGWASAWHVAPSLRWELRNLCHLLACFEKRGGYNQQQLDSLAVAKDMGESVGLLQGLLCDTLPVWGLVLSGSLHYLVGFSALWAVAAGHIKPLSFPVVSAPQCPECTRNGVQTDTSFGTACSLRRSHW